MAEMRTDAETLRKEAENFNNIAAELKNQIAHVEATAGALARHWTGQAGRAAQSALLRFQEAATKQIHELDEISRNIHAASGQYTTADEEQHQVLVGQMGF